MTVRELKEFIDKVIDEICHDPELPESDIDKWRGTLVKESDRILITL